MEIKEYLERKGIEVISQRLNLYECKYKGNQIVIVKNSGVNRNYILYVNNNIITTGALITTCVNKILRLEEIK